MTEQLKLALEGITTLTKALQGTRRIVTNALSTFASDSPALPKVAKVVSDLERAPEAVRRAIPELEAAVGAARLRLAHLEAERRDVVKRRDQLAAAAKQKDVRYRFTDAADYVGPFRLEHSEAAVIIRLGKTAVARLKSPTGGELLAGATRAEDSLKRAALLGWDEFIVAAHKRQLELSSTEAVPWRALLEAAVPDPKARRRLGPVLFYRLAMLVSSTAPDGWIFSITPPALGEQRSAFEVSNLQHPGEPIRVARGRLSRGGTAKES